MGAGDLSQSTRETVLTSYVTRAGNYQCGESEEIIGEWMKARNNREEIIVATKYTSAWQLHNQDTKIQSNYGGNNKKSLVLSLETSLRALQTSYIDLVSFCQVSFVNYLLEMLT